MLSTASGQRARSAVVQDAAHAMVREALARSVVGGPETVQAGLKAFIARNRPDELMVAAQLFDPAARLRSFEILAKAHMLTPAA